MTQLKSLFPFLKSEEEAALLHSAARQTFGAEQLVFEQNERLRTIFLIVDGLVRIERWDNGQLIPLAILGAGEFFGEMSFVDDAPASARAVAQEPTRLLAIDAAEIDRLTIIDPAFSGRLYRSLAAILVQRLRRTSMLLSLDNRQL
jgi:CRP/FNR family transcriptional regulator, cyclic AMP receptor protein